MLKPTADYKYFEALDIRLGKVIRVEDSTTLKPTYRITVDFGSEIGTKISCGAFRNYPKEALLNKIIVGVVNFSPKRMGEEISEFLILGVTNEKNQTIYLTTECDAPIGSKIF